MKKHELILGKHDIGNESLEIVLENFKSLEPLFTLVNLSRKTFGFFNKTITRCYEYPFIVKEIGGISGKRVLDIGTGLSPLPLFLAEQGASVVTVDNSTIVRSIDQTKENWDGWGYFDYGELSDNIISYNEDIFSINLSSDSLDCIYSVSVIEHLPVATRRSMWPIITELLIKKGTLLLTMDLVPNTYSLWNYCQGEIVDSVDAHGDIEVIKEEIDIAGLTINDCNYLRNLPDSKVDVVLLSITKNC